MPLLRTTNASRAIPSAIAVAGCLRRRLLAAGVALSVMFCPRLDAVAAPHPSTAASPNAVQKADADAAAPNNAWRFRYHAGYWWYWLPTESWVWHDGRRWIDYEVPTPRRVAAILVQRPDRTGTPERYQSGEAPAPPAAVEELRDELEELKRTVQRLETRLTEGPQAQGSLAKPSGEMHPLSDADEARLFELWRVRQNAINFYDLHSDAYYFTGKGHFTD